MTVVTGLTKERMEEIEAACIVSGAVVVDDLILTTFGGDDINAGNVRGPMGPSGSGHEVCTSSTRPTYDSGDAGKTIFETDTNLVYIWLGSVWRVQERIFGLSTDYPTLTSDDAGAVFYETDTGFEYLWNGSIWIAVSPPLRISATVNSIADHGNALCNGGTLSRTGNGKRIFDIIGTLFGIGNGTSTFNVPNFEGYTLAMVGGAIAGAIGSKSGSTTHTLTIAQMPAHTHIQNPHSHSVAPMNTLAAGGGFPNPLATNNVGFDVSGDQTAVNQNEGGGGSHPNVQPTALVNWQISL